MQFAGMLDDFVCACFAGAIDQRDLVSNSCVMHFFTNCGISFSHKRITIPIQWPYSMKTNKWLA